MVKQLKNEVGDDTAGVGSVAEKCVFIRQCYSLKKC